MYGFLSGHGRRGVARLMMTLIAACTLVDTAAAQLELTACNTTEFQNYLAIIQATPGGGTLYLEPGIYEVSGENPIVEPTTIIGSGHSRTIFSSTETTVQGRGMFYIQAPTTAGDHSGTLRLEGLGFEHFPRPIISVDLNAVVDGMTMRDCRVSDNGFWVIDSNPNGTLPLSLRNTLVSGCLFSDFTHGVRLRAVTLENAVLENNTLENFTGSGMLIGADELNGAVQYANAGTRIRRNNIRDMKVDSNQEIAIYAAGDDIVIEDNHLSQIGPYMATEALDVFGIYTKGRNVVIRRNKVRDIHTTDSGRSGYAIYAKGAHLDQTNNLSPLAYQNLIADNWVDSVVSGGHTTGIGTTNDGMVIRNNQVRVRGRGIYTFNVTTDGGPNPSDPKDRVLTNHIVVEDNRVEAFDGYAFFLSHSYNGLTVRRNEAVSHETYHAMSIGDTDYNSSSDLILTDNVIRLVTDSFTAEAALNVSSGVGTTNGLQAALIARNIIDGDIGLQLKSGGSDITVTENRFRSPTPVVVVGSGGQYRAYDNEGLPRAVKTGSAAFGAADTTVTVTHGLGYAPDVSQLQIAPTSALGSANTYTVTHITGTTFDITLNVQPGSAVTFDWQATYNALN